MTKDGNCSKVAHEARGSTFVIENYGPPIPKLTIDPNLENFSNKVGPALGPIINLGIRNHLDKTSVAEREPTIYAPGANMAEIPSAEKRIEFGNYQQDPNSREKVTKISHQLGLKLKQKK